MEDINAKMISLDKRISNIESTIQTNILKIAIEHTKILHEISEKLKIHDGMFIELADSFKDFASNSLKMQIQRKSIQSTSLTYTIVYLRLTII